MLLIKSKTGWMHKNYERPKQCKSTLTNLRTPISLQETYDHVQVILCYFDVNTVPLLGLPVKQLPLNRFLLPIKSHMLLFCFCE
ncbi:hypothetical protein AGOR_G00042980 [Albula goreensis]|uniref:Uncharacterized protein n=1 Tax=Albula goreensis TaxID=1534307 RepID=A0A8T3DZ14_9TELE|nr:hypothetical protein AGOR_G00042980 [Albula goreensis]